MAREWNYVEETYEKDISTIHQLCLYNFKSNIGKDFVYCMTDKDLIASPGAQLFRTTPLFVHINWLTQRFNIALLNAAVSSEAGAHLKEILEDILI